MPVLSRCPLCRGVMPDARGEARCPRCGELVLPAVRKLCAGCGGDVTRTKRVRSDDGEYFCHDCSSAQLAARGERPGYVCYACGLPFPPGQVYQDGDGVICVECLRQRNVDPNDLLEAAAHIGDEAPAVFAPTRAYGRPSDVPWGWISFGIAVLMATVGAVAVLAVR